MGLPPHHKMAVIAGRAQCPTLSYLTRRTFPQAQSLPHFFSGASTTPVSMHLPPTHALTPPHTPALHVPTLKQAPSPHHNSIVSSQQCQKNWSFNWPHCVTLPPKRFFPCLHAHLWPPQAPTYFPIITHR